MSQTPSIRRVVIVGAGFAGLNCAQRLAADPNLHITVIDKNNYQQFQPLLYQVAMGILTADNAAFNLRSVLASHENVDVKMEDIASVDLATRTASSTSGAKYQGDFLVLAAGAEANFFSIPGVSEHAFPLYSLLDAERLRSRVLEILEAADKGDPIIQADGLQFVVIGGGPTGVEIAGAMADLFQRTPHNAFKNVDLARARVTLIDQAAKVLTPFTAKSQDYAADILRRRGVELRLGVSVSEVKAGGVTLSDGTSISAPLVVWAGGLKAARLSRSAGIPPGKGGRIDVEPDLSVAGFPGVYAVGDFANFRTASGKALPQLASVAQQAGRHCARNIVAAAAGESETPFEYFDKGIMAMVGRNAAVAEVGSNHHALTGPLAFAAWLGVHALLLTTAKAKVETFLEWAWEYFGHVHVDPILDRPSLNWSVESQPSSKRPDEITASDRTSASGS